MRYFSLLQIHSKIKPFSWPGPALCLYFAALRSTTNPPSVPLPRTSKSSAPIELSHENCPPTFMSFLRVWADTVDRIQALVPEQQHDLARVICGIEALHPDSVQAVSGIAADLRAVAIEISQRRSFQNRYASDLQAALDAGNTAGSASPRKTSFVPPPVYDPTPSPTTPITPSRSSGIPVTPPVPSPGLLSPYPYNHHAASSSVSSISSTSSDASTTPSILTQDAPAIEFIRETLYASLADVLERQTSLHRLLKQDPPRAYFSSVAFAILDVASTAVTPDGAIIGVLGKPLTLEDCPRALKPFMIELTQIGQQAKQIEEEDNQSAIELAQQGQEIPVSRLDRVKFLLEEGIGSERDLRDARRGRRSVEGRSVAFTNRINALSLSMTRLKPFRERQEAIFEILAGIGSS